jgi:hypothetical protein
LFSQNNILNESIICLTCLVTTPGLAISVNDFGNIRIFFDGQADQFPPITGGYQVEKIVGQIAHQKKLAGKELAIHLIGLKGKEGAETADSLGVKTLSGIRPFEGMGKKLIPRLHEGQDGGTKFLNGTEVIVDETFPFNDAEPYFDQVQPGGMERHEVHDNAFVL